MTQLVMIVDDDPIQRRLLDAQVAKMGFRTLHCDGGTAAVEALTARSAPRVDALVLDLMMPDMTGIEVMRELRSAGLDLPIVVQTAKGSIDTVVEAMRAGAFDFVVKPVSPDKLHKALSGAIRVAEAGRPTAMRPDSGGRFMAGYEPGAALRPVIEQGMKAARSGIPLLIQGETGVGKEWLARSIHAAGSRAEGPFVAVNCGALPSGLVESVLFGHVKGAFTDAAERHLGKFLEADKGTLFLDEIGELPSEIQVKLLRVLQDGEVDPVGGRAPVRADIRLISATNRDLAGAVRDGRFREDLFYRLDVLSVSVPPLRRRVEEIAPLANAFLARFARVEKASPARSLSGEALALLQRYDWPGNIRQLENAMHRAVVLAEAESLTPSDFPQISGHLLLEEDGPADRAAPAFPDAEGGEGREVRREATSAVQSLSARDADALDVRDAAGDVRRMEAVEADLIRLALKQYNGRMSEIARKLGIGRSTLYRKIREYKIDV